MNDDRDDIVFEEIRYREPRKERRPDRDRRFACAAYEVPGIEDLPIFLDRATADAIERHALRDTNVELGGILLGKECVDVKTAEAFVWITQSLEAKHYENTQASFTYTHDSWEDISRERDRLHADLDIVGWYHTHPDFGVFLSSHDQFIHHHFFGQSLQLAYVVDPIRRTRGFFQWRDGTLAETEGFFLVAPRKERAALARTVNDLENLPSDDGGGGGLGLSPRLEAELIDMLSRTRQSEPAVDRAQTATVYTMLGVLLAGIVLAGFLWMNMTVRQDTERAIEQAIARVAKSETSDEARISAKESAMDDLIKHIDRDVARKSILKALESARGDAEAARRDLKNALNEKDALNLQADRLKKERDDARIAFEKSEAARKTAVETGEKLNKERDELADTIDEFKNTEKGSLAFKYNIAWALSIAFFLLSCGLGATFALLRKPAAPLDEPAPVENPHRIE